MINFFVTNLDSYYQGGKTMYMNYFVEMAKEKTKDKIQTVAVAAPHDDSTLESLRKAKDLGFVNVILVGDENKILEISKEYNIDVSDMKMVHADTLEECAQKAVEEVKNGHASLIMKGLIDTSIILKSVVKRENELRTGKTLSYVGIMFKDGFHKYYLTSDGAMLIAPTLEQKKDIIENAVDVAHSLGQECPKVAMLCAKEKYYDKMPATVDADALQKMNENGEIKGCIVSGPLQVDNAVDKHAAEIKGVMDPVAGDADILVVPAIEAGNILLKAAKYLGGWTYGGVVVGAKVPIVVCSRSDGEDAKLVSVAVACLIANKNNK